MGRAIADSANIEPPVKSARVRRRLAPRDEPTLASVHSLAAESEGDQRQDGPTAPCLAMESSAGAGESWASEAPLVAWVPSPGTRFGSGGRYEFIEQLAIGGMGRVYRVFDWKLERCLAAKIPLHAGSRAAQLLVEARALASFGHEGIVSIVDVDDSQEVPIMLMEFIPGQTLAELLEDGALAPSRATDIALEIASALEHAHGRGICHHDLKPSNVLVQPGGRAKLVDFGVGASASLAKGDDGVPQTTGVTGTPSYMAPEQWTCTVADARTDFWALGAVLFEMLVGRPPFDARTLRLERWRLTTPRLPSRCAGRATRTLLDAVLCRLLEPNPELRIQSATTVRRLLDACARRVRRGEPRTLWIGDAEPTRDAASG